MTRTDLLAFGFAVVIGGCSLLLGLMLLLSHVQVAASTERLVLAGGLSIGVISLVIVCSALLGQVYRLGKEVQRLGQDRGPAPLATRVER